MLPRIQFQVATAARGAILAARKSERLIEADTHSGFFDAGSNPAGRFNRNGSSTRQMILSSTWLASGAAVLDDRGRVVQWNDEFADWAGSSLSGHPFITEILGQRCPAWPAPVKALLEGAETFQELLLEDASARPPHCYKL